MSQIYRLVCPIISKRNIESIYIYSESQSNGFLFSWRSSEGDVQTVLPDWATFWGRSAVLPDWATFWGRSAVLPDWATFWGRSDSVARLGYLLRTFRPCCQIGLLFEDVQTVLPDWATFWGRSDSVARLGYLLRTFRQCCQIQGYYFWGRSS